MNNYYSELDSLELEQMEMEEASRILNAVTNFDDLEEIDFGWIDFECGVY